MLEFKRGGANFYGRAPKKIEEWLEWYGIVVTHIDARELRLDDLREMHQSDDFTAMEAVEYIKLEKGL